MRLMRPGVLHIERAPLLPHPPGLKGPADPNAQEGGDEGLYDVKRQERRHGTIVFSQVMGLWRKKAKLSRKPRAPMR